MIAENFPTPEYYPCVVSFFVSSESDGVDLDFVRQGVGSADDINKIVLRSNFVRFLTEEDKEEVSKAFVKLMLNYYGEEDEELSAIK
jgi:hypothetical protein